MERMLHTFIYAQFNFTKSVMKCLQKSDTTTQLAG